MVKRKGAVFIAAVIGAADSKTRFSCASKTIEASAAAVSIKTPVKKGDKVVENVSVSGGITKNVNLVAAEDVTLIVWNGDEPRSVINAEEAYAAPVRAGDKAGTLEYIFEISGESVSIDLVLTETWIRRGLPITLCSALPNGYMYRPLCGLKKRKRYDIMPKRIGNDGAKAACRCRREGCISCKQPACAAAQSSLLSRVGEAA